MKNVFKRASLALGLVISLAAMSAFAQHQPQTRPEGVEKQGDHWGHKRHGRGGFGGMGGGRIMSELNLTDAQKQQLRALHERYRESFQAKRGEFRQLFEQRREGATLSDEQKARAQALRAELRQLSEQMHNEMLAILTPEQRTQLEQKRKELFERRQERQQQRRERRERRMQDGDQSNPQ